ncbi:MAG TPA: GvpL/GvpF family gas vesicle protein [Thermoanaerobaculia bacterium]|nr:GvpL/GvpF family gas vesicle protein [Thermoanaerobaculia bacterium]
MIYVYCVTRDAVTPQVDGIDGMRRFGTVTIDAVSAVFTRVNADEFSQEVIDRRAGDLEWLGAIGYRHQDVVSDLMKRTAIVPLRAFTLFSSDEALRSYLQEHGEMLSRVLERLDGKQEWTLRVEFDPARWSESLAARVASLRDLQNEIETAAPGKAFLLRKKLDDERKRASHAAEQEVVGEIERLVAEKLRCETVAETREGRDGGFPQINVLINRDEEATLQELHDTMTARYESEGVTLGLTGPWPPYTFANLS